MNMHVLDKLKNKWNKPLGADQLLELGREVFEPLFHEPPLGPIPEYLQPHSSVHGCVAEYEEKIDELDRWKAGRLEAWLSEKVGKRWYAGENLYELYVEEGVDDAPERYWFKLIEEGFSQES